MVQSLTLVAQLNAHDKLMMYRGELSSTNQQFFAYMYCQESGTKRKYPKFEKLAANDALEKGKLLYFDTIPEPDAEAKAFLKNWLKARNYA